MLLKMKSNLLLLVCLTGLLCSSKAFTFMKNVGRIRSSSILAKSTITDNSHREFLENIAKVDFIPKRLDSLISLIPLFGEDEVIPPNNRKDMNPFLIPIARSKSNKGTLCYIRWPTQKKDMELQLVRTTEAGIMLESLTTDAYILRKAVESDFEGNEKKSQQILDEYYKDQEASESDYKVGDYIPFFKCGKFSTITEADRRVVLDKYLLTKVGQFPDSYERIADKFYEEKNEISALVTCERSMSIFYGWGFPSYVHSEMLKKVPGRDKEARDSARAAMNMPSWTIGQNLKDLERCAQTAGFTGLEILAEMHEFRSKDPRTDEIGEGLSPIQVTLDQAAHLMDAIGLGKGSWEESRDLLAEKYEEGGYPDMAKFIRNTA